MIHFNKRLAKVFKDNNKELFLVGGAVRDFLMGNESDDLDFATNATPEEMMSMNAKTIPTGFDHGTVTFLINGESFEVTTFRKDVNTDGRHATVEFSKTIEEDLSRRDFVINSLAMDEKGNIIDPFNGKGDIENGLIKAVGNANERITEDFLRMLRALRFAARFDFILDSDLFDAIEFNANNLWTTVSAERVRMEIMKAAKSNNFMRFIRLMKVTNILKNVFPEVNNLVGLEQNDFHNTDAFEHTMNVISKLEREETFPLTKIAALLHDIGKASTKTIDTNNKVHFLQHETVGANMAETAMRRLKFSKKEITFVSGLVRNHMKTKSFGDQVLISDKAIRKLITRTDNLTSLLKIIDADNKSHSFLGLMPNQITILKRRINELGKTPVKIALPVNGNDIMKRFNLKSGLKIGTILKEVEEMVLENPKITKEEVFKCLIQ